MKLVMSATSLVVVGVALRASAQPPAAAGVVSAAPSGPPRHAPSRPTPRPQNRYGSRTAPPGRSSPAVHPSARPSAARPRPADLGSVTVAGDVVETQYGRVQVEISVQGGEITRAGALARPSGDGQTDAINRYAVPRLDQESLAAQSAQIDTVSGATFTSEGYRQSLQSALDAAHRAGAR